MGCWYETCDITNLPLTAGERCVMIDFDRMTNPAELMNSGYNSYAVLRITKGRYSEYGDLKEFPDNNYPGIKPERGKEYLMRPKYVYKDGLLPVVLRSFIKESVWDKIIAEIEGRSITDENNQPITLEEARKKLKK